MKFETPEVKKYFFIIFAFGVLARCYGLSDHWKNNDHYNFGGTMMTHALKCLKSTPLEISRGLIITECDTGKPNIYINYTPVFLYGMWVTTEIFGEGEWAHRLFFLIFSALNIGLVFLIARAAWPREPRVWLLGAFFQAFFLSPMYLGTHMDPITEFTLTPMLASTLFLLQGRSGWACGWALVAGLTTWIGYFQFFPILLYAWARKEKLGLVVFLTGISALICFGSMMYLRETWNIFSFVGQKLTDPEYIRPPTTSEKLLLPLHFVRNFFQSLARLLSPLFATMAIFELVWGEGRKIFSGFSKLEKPHWAFLLTGLAFFVYLVPGFKYAMVHIHNYIFAVPMWALLCASFVTRLWQRELVVNRTIFLLLSLIFVASYPYGIYQSSLVHDIFNSVLFVGSALGFAYMIWNSQSRRGVRKASLFGAVLIGTSAVANFSQVVNYRNEADTEFPFCEKAREEFARTGQPVHTKERQTRTKEYLYCRGIPIVYESG